MCGADKETQSGGDSLPIGAVAGGSVAFLFLLLLIILIVLVWRRRREKRLAKARLDLAAPHHITENINAECECPLKLRQGNGYGKSALILTCPHYTFVKPAFNVLLFQCLFLRLLLCSEKKIEFTLRADHLVEGFFNF